MAASLTKQELRTIYREKRMALSKDEVIILSEKILRNFILQFSPFENQTVNIFLSIEKWNEVHTQILIDYFFKSNIRVFVPKIQNGKMISVEIFPDSKFEISRLGIREPSSGLPANVALDYVLVPCLYCDSFGNRVGYGKGFYDQFLKEYGKIEIKIGLNFFLPEQNITDVYENDIPMDALITPNKVFVFR